MNQRNNDNEGYFIDKNTKIGMNIGIIIAIVSIAFFAGQKYLELDSNEIDNLRFHDFEETLKELNQELEEVNDELDLLSNQMGDLKKDFEKIDSSFETQNKINLQKDETQDVFISNTEKKIDQVVNKVNSFENKIVSMQSDISYIRQEISNKN